MKKYLFALLALSMSYGFGASAPTCLGMNGTWSGVDSSPAKNKLSVTINLNKDSGMFVGYFDFTDKYIEDRGQVGNNSTCQMDSNNNEQFIANNTGLGGPMTATLIQSSTGAQLQVSISYNGTGQLQVFTGTLSKSSSPSSDKNIF